MVRAHSSKRVFFEDTRAGGITGSSIGMDAKRMEEKTTWRCMKAGTNWCDQGLKEGRGVLEMKDGSCYYGFWKRGKRHGPGLLFELDKDTQRARYSKVLYEDDELKKKSEDQLTEPQELLEAYAPAFHLFHQ